MKKIIFICFILLLALTGGCSMNDNDKNNTNDNKTEAAKPKDMDPKDLPQVPAFQDERTREYMVSTKEEEPGYYLLESKLKGFRVLFPENAEYVPDLSSTGENEETIVFDSFNKKTNIQYDGQLDYHQQKSFANDKDTMLDIVSGRNSYKGKYEERELSDKIVYSAQKKSVFDDVDGKNNFSYRFFGYVKSTKEDYIGIEYSFRFACYKDEEACLLKKEEARKKVQKIIDSITFLKVKKEK
ncbi:lipoprotein YvcA [Bacillus inaquosorum]|uniref:lipoprotein YvcA n=1 Tax=Bacillus inaquosorum TaxID=483913 RepID=UPI00227F223F|nr:lipoprotein YvcA [Bacillus inaquosorum]MCY8994534.1 lipoprotein YvcA [Bacillus inaquosorum]MCY9007937.1 lipoprotein YvcA [Bacillus inaquosorum]MCY9029314.1 lipoprotein YvcA [Bacillus inaquosorum]MCY9038694.1 lipoprotein YvcA [Bacillus inaquosorum]MCY9044246.1 lipoprotein YvcA [Bacillus inaquosorum]